MHLSLNSSINRPVHLDRSVFYNAPLTFAQRHGIHRTCFWTEDRALAKECKTYWGVLASISNGSQKIGIMVGVFSKFFPHRISTLLSLLIQPLGVSIPPPSARGPPPNPCAEFQPAPLPDRRTKRAPRRGMPSRGRRSARSGSPTHTSSGPGSSVES